MNSLTSDRFRDLIGRFASGVTVITAVDGGESHGITASAVSSLSLDPPMLLICMNKESATGRAVVESGRFAVNVLGEDYPDLAMRFATKGDGKFKGVATSVGPGGQTLLVDALATFECRVVEEVTSGTHTVFIASVEHAAGGVGAPLAYFRGKFGRLCLDADHNTVNDVRSLLIARRIQPGDRLDVDALAADLKIPRGAIFHALSVLATEGLLHRHNGGFEMPQSGRNVVVDAISAMSSITMGVTDMTIASVPSAQRCDLRDLLDKLHHSLNSQDAKFARGLRDFYRALLATAGSSSLEHAWAAINISAVTNVLVGRPTMSEHRRVYECLTAFVDAFSFGDRTTAVNALREHFDILLDLNARPIRPGPHQTTKAEATQ